MNEIIGQFSKRQLIGIFTAAVVALPILWAFFVMFMPMK